MPSIIASKSGLNYSGPELDAMRLVAEARTQSSLTMLQVSPSCLPFASRVLALAPLLELTTKLYVGTAGRSNLGTSMQAVLHFTTS